MVATPGSVRRASNPEIGYTPPAMARILVTDDHDALREGMALTLTRLATRSSRAGVAPRRRRLPQEARRRGRHRPQDGPVDGIEVVRRLREHDPDATVLVVSAHGTIATAVEAMQEGATTSSRSRSRPTCCAPRSRRPSRSPASAGGARTARRRAEALDEDLVRAHDPHGSSAAASRCSACSTQVRKVAATDATVLVLGESGTGKELVARASTSSPRAASGPFVSSPARRSPRRCSSRSCSATSGAPSPAPSSASSAASSSPTGDALPRRDRRDPAVGADEAPARAAGAGVRARRRRGDARGRRARRLRDEPRPRRGGRRTGRFREDLYYRLARGAPRAAAAARAPRGHRGARAVLRRAASRRGWAGREAASRPRRSSCCAATAGRGTCASWRT